MELLVADAGNSTTTIPVDLVVEIISLLPAKSIIRFQSVSKQWFSIIRSKDLVDTFLARSNTRPHLLLALELFSPGKPPLFFSVINEKTSTAIARHDMTHSTGIYYHFSSRPVNGFVCFTGIFSSMAVSNTIIVFNPITRQTVILPDVRNNGRKVCELLGYDPVEDQYKVLCVMMCLSDQREHYVCTVSSTQKQEWRKIDSTTVDNYPCVFQGICINGAIYYGGVGESNIVRFDVRSERIRLIKAPEASDISRTWYSTLVNYNGRLGGVEFDYYIQEIKLWILEDVEKQEWSSATFKYPYEWKGFGCHLESNGVIHTGELMHMYSAMIRQFHKEETRQGQMRFVMMEEIQQNPKTLFCRRFYFICWKTKKWLSFAKEQCNADHEEPMNMRAYV
ncbi:hypothetical protein Bca52824_003312 [Brassica carinata]|uniref:F-box domain-containing protein n=1 Tax=Brassica carinata TaxID=52824 RepID=A0A8X7WMG4_BRACI|nr:hypothetical protein Bca52824_003312 [Brassica carinata]